MGSDKWQPMSLGEFVTLQRGHDLPEPDRRPGGIPVLGSFGITGYHDVAKAKGPGVTVGRSGASFGVVTFCQEDFWPLNTALYVVDFHGNDERFAYYHLKSLNFEGYNSGSAQPSLNRNYIHPMPIVVPPLSEQRAIACILGTLDDKIELNRRMNETLEAMARALFKSWFVDFDPVYAKAEGRQPAGMDAETAALFPDGFEESRLGLVPAGWQTHTLGAVVDYLSRGIQPTYVTEGGVLVINQKCIRNHRISFEDARRHNADKRDISGRELVLGDVLVNSTGVGTLGRIAQVEYLPEPSIVDSHVTVIRARADRITPNMLGLMLMEREAEIEELGEGSTGQTELNRERLRALTVLAPPLPIQHHFDAMVIPVRARAVANQRESHRLAAIRDALLPKLISGEVRIA